ncbi:unnamed protein product [Umbelopsis ramanniana]
MERKSISDALELALESASNEYQAQSTDFEHVSADESDDSSAEDQRNRKRKRDALFNSTTRNSVEEDPTIPSCPIVSNPILIARTFDLVIILFALIASDNVVYNVGEKSGTFLEYNFNGLPHIPEAIYEQAVRSAPSQTFPSETAGQRALTHRRRIYHDSMIPDPGYPSVSRRHLNTTNVLPYHIAKIKPFVTRELRALLGDYYEPIIEKQVLDILLIPHNRFIESRRGRDHKTSDDKRAMRITMNDDSIIDLLSEWIPGGENNTGFARRFVTEVMAFLRSGMSLNTFTTNVHYRREG